MIVRGTFGVARMQDGVSGGQGWISGSSGEFSEWGRAVLDERFPSLPRQNEDDRTGGGGVLHVRRGRQWHIVFVFQPRFSLRSVPMWLAARLPESAFATSMVLPQLVQQILQAVHRIEAGGDGGEVWTQAGELPVAEPAGLNDFRTALALDRLPSGASINVTNPAVLRAIQLRLQAEVEAMPEASARAWAVLRMATTGSIRWKSQGAPIQEFTMGSHIPESLPYEFRSVSDSSLIRHASPSSVLAGAIRARLTSKAVGDLSRFVAVPIPLLPGSVVRRDEAAAWAAAIWRDGKRAQQELKDAVGGGSGSIRNPVFAIAALLVHHPLARQNRVDDIETLLRELEVFGAQRTVRSQMPP